MKLSAACAGLLLGLSVCTQAVALTALERDALEELSCHRAPKPTRILQTLAEQKKINTSDNLGYDSMSCFSIEGGFMLSGVNFTSVCAFEEDEFIRELNPDLYYRAPGTSPGQFISFGTDVSGDSLADWYLQIFGPAHVSSAINDGDRTNSESKSEVECSSWMAH